MTASRINISISMKTYHAIRHALGFAAVQGLSSREMGNGANLDLDAGDFAKARAEIEGFRIVSKNFRPD